MGKQRIKPTYRRRVLSLPDLDHCKTVVLNSNGLCVANSLSPAAECHRYDGVEVEVGGLVIRQVSAGGWGLSELGLDCAYPAFEGTFASDLLTVSPNVKVRIDGEQMAVPVTVDTAEAIC